MEKLKKMVGILLVYCLMITAIPTNTLAQTIKATKNTVPKYLDYSEAYVKSAMQYKDKTLLNTMTSTRDSKGIKYINNGKISYINNFFPYTQIWDKLVFDKSNNKILNLETGRISLIFNNAEYIKAESLVKEKYKNSSSGDIAITPIKSTGKVKWSQYAVSIEKNGSYYGKKGFVNSNSKIYEFSTNEIDDSRAEDFYVYKDSLYYFNSEKNLMVIGADGNSHKYVLNSNLKKTFNYEYPIIYVNKDGIYLRYADYSKSDWTIFLQKVKIVNNQVVSTGNKPVNINSQTSPASISIDINGNMWTAKAGFIYKFENDSLVKKYEVDKRMNGVYVYDDNHLTVSGYDSITKKGIYRIINKKYNVK